MGVHCSKCGRHVVLDPAKLHLSPETPVPSLAGRFNAPLRIKADLSAAGMAKPPTRVSNGGTLVPRLR
jgi:hypothetical protein